MRSGLWSIIAASALLGACSAPTFDELGTFPCAINGECPTGFSCGLDNKCSKGLADSAVATPDASDASADAGQDATVADANDAGVEVKDATQDAPADVVADAKDGAADASDASDASTDAPVVASKIIVAPTSGSTSESGTTFQFTVELSAPPAANVTFSVTSSNAAEGTVTPSSLNFTTATWSVKQTVTVTGVADGTWDYDKSYTVVFGASTSTDPAWAGIVGAPVAMTNADVDAPVIKLASMSASNVHGNGQSGGLSTASGYLGGPSLPSSGDAVYFASEASNLTSIDTNALSDTFFRSRTSAFTMPISGNLSNGTCNGMSTRPIISGDGKYPMYRTTCTSPNPWLTPGCIIQEMQSGTVAQVSTSTSCVPYDLSTDARYALFTEPVNGVTTLKRFDRISATSTTITDLGWPTSVSSASASMSNDGRYVAFVSTNAFQGGDTNGVADLYIVDMNNPGTFVRASAKSDGTELPSGVTAGGISGDGNYVWFVTRDVATSADTDADADLYLVHRTTPGSTALASRMATGGAVGVADVSTDGRHYAFEFTPSGGNKEVWVYDRVNQTTKSAHKTYNGGVPNGATELPVISGDGIWIAYVGWASNLVASDTNGTADVFILPRP